MTDIIEGSHQDPDRPPGPPAPRDNAMIASKSDPKSATEAPRALDEVSNKRYPREQEGFGRTLGSEDTSKNQALSCSTMFSSLPGLWASAPRGWYPMPASLARRHIEWETTPAEAA